MKRYGLLGYPLGHSFSARFFAEKFRREGIDAEYVNFEMPSVEGLRAFVASDPELCGLNVTIPHKQAVIPHLDALTDEAQAIGAVNVIAIERREGALRLVGANTDAVGFRRSIEPLLRPCLAPRIAVALDTSGRGFAAFGVSYLPFGVLVDAKKRALWMGNTLQMNKQLLLKITK